MTRVRFGVSVVASVAAVLAAGCGADRTGQPAAQAKSGPTCPAAWRAGWQQLANRIATPVYCPSWLPDPLVGKITGRGDYVLSVDPKDRSYLASFTWVEPQSGEIHVNLRGYPGRTAIPICIASTQNRGKLRKTKIPCFSDPRGTVRERGIRATVYTVNQDADLWHVLYAWRHKGSLYTVSEHVAKPLTYRKVVANLNRMLGTLELIEPTANS
jgi:hypothetical protein